MREKTEKEVCFLAEKKNAKDMNAKNPKAKNNTKAKAKTNNKAAGPAKNAENIAAIIQNTQTHP